MTGSGLNIHAPGVFTVCIDGNGGEEYSGRLFHCYNKGGVQFIGAGAILYEMEKVFDRINFPQASTEARSFGKSRSEAKYEREGVNKVMSEEEVAGKKGDKGTFVVHIQYRQHATWQGKVLWAEKNRTQNFRSALELLKLIDSALDEDQESND